MIAALVNHLWQSTLFCGAAWLITLMLRANGAALRHWIWLLASAKFLVPFSLLFFAGSLIGMPAARIADNEPLILGKTLENVSVLVAPGVAQSPGSSAPPVLMVAGGALWLGVSLFLATRWLLAWRVANSIVRAARPAPGAPADARITDADIEPAVARVFHPVVLLPAALLGRLTDTQLSAVLAHEREHIARHDNLKANLHRLVETLFWFHPAVWWIGRQMLEERERACDEAVLDRGHDGAEYAGGILEVCRHCRGSISFSAAATGGSLTRRVRYILGSARPATPGVGKVMSLLVMTLCVATVPLFAGAVTEGARKQQLFAVHSRILGSAEISVSPASDETDATHRVIADERGVVIRNSSLRDLVALAYGVQRWQISGGPWLDSSRYDVRAIAGARVSHPDELEPYALRGLVAKLLASRFELEIHVNRRCQSPCGKNALTAPHDAR
jgi:beta-lactamase regulating signal transducer with metallopeptidase domain